MASRFYLRDLPPTTPVSGDPLSSAIPGGSEGNLGYGNNSLRTDMGGVQRDRGGSTIHSVAHWDDYFRAFVSEALSAQTITAQTWTLALSTSESDAGANSYTVCSLYVYRPSTTSVVGYIYDSDTPLGSEWGTVATGQVLTFAGAQVIAVASDQLVLELWRHTNTAALPIAYESLWQWNGSVPVTAGATSDAASYLETPQLISLLAGGGATISGTIAMAAPVTQIAMIGRTTPGRVGAIAMAAPETAISMTGVATAAVAATGRTFNPGFAYTVDELVASVEANSSFNSCPLDHTPDTTPAHKEPAIDPIPGDAAYTQSTRVLVHIQGPDGEWRTTSVMPPA
jgi:hypothetical protein